jgi:hypothetical protein
MIRWWSAKKNIRAQFKKNGHQISLMAVAINCEVRENYCIPFMCIEFVMPESEFISTFDSKLCAMLKW